MGAVRRGLFVGMLAALALSATPGAQTPPAGQADQQPPEPGQPTFRAGVTLITTDVIVRDSRGQFVPDLKEEDFEVYEDDVPQEVASLVLVHGGRAYNLQAPPPPKPQEGIILPPSRPTSDTAGRIFLIFIDDLHLDFRNTPRLRQLVRKIADQLVHEGDMFGVVSTGPSSLAMDLTYDRDRLYDAIKRISGAGLRPVDIIEGPQGSQGPSEVRYRAHVAFSTAYDIVQQLEGVANRRKAFVYISNGYDFNPFLESRGQAGTAFGGRFLLEDQQGGLNANPFIPQDSAVFADADLARELAELTRAANRANASFYTIDPRGLVGGPDIDDEISMTEFNEYLRQSQDSLRVLAEETGGIAVVNQNDFDQALARIDAETSDYYVLGYYSSNPDLNDRVRRLEIKVKREGLDVWSRRTYTLKPPPPPTSSDR